MKPAARQRETHSYDPSRVVVSINDYDPMNPRKITERASIRAMKNLCITKSELKMPSKEDLKDLDDPEIVEIVNNHHKKRIGKLIKQIKSERERIIQNSDSPGREMRKMTSRSIDTTQRTENAVDYDKRLVEKMQKRQKREVEQMIATIIALDAIRKDEEIRAQLEEQRRKEIEEERKRKREEAHKKHLQAVQEMERQEQLKLKQEAELRRVQFEREQKALKRQQEEHERKLKEMAEAEKKRQERAEQNRLYIQKVEEDRQQRIMQQQRIIEEREIRRLEALRIEQERIQKEKELATKKRQEQIAAAKAKEIALLEEKRRQVEQKELEREEQRERFIKEKEEENIKFREMQEAKVRRNAENRIRIAEQDARTKARSATTNEEIDRRIKQMEALKEKRAEDARLNRSDAALAAQRKQELWKKHEEELNSKIKREQAEKEVHINSILEEKERERQKQILMRKLKEEEKVETAHRLERQRQKRVEALKEKIDNSMAHAEEVQEERKTVHMQRQTMLMQLEKQRMRMSDTFEQIKVTGKTNRKEMEKLAREYGLDIQQIEMRTTMRLPLSPTMRARTALSSARRSTSVSSARSLF